MRVFETRTATGSEMFFLLTCLHTTTFTLLSIFSPSEMISIKIWETPLSWHVKCSLPVAVRVSKTRVPYLPNKNKGGGKGLGFIVLIPRRLENSTICCQDSHPAATFRTNQTAPSGERFGGTRMQI